VQTLRVVVVLLSLLVAMLAYALWGRAGRERSAALPPKELVVPVWRLTEVRPVKEIDLEYHSPDLPPGPGQDVFATQCVICHSARYVLNQPAFPRKTWTRPCESLPLQVFPLLLASVLQSSAPH
jgi:hypothetical protein